MQPETNVNPDNKVWAFLIWLFSPLVPIIVLLLEDKKNDPFLKYNAVQSLILGAVGYILSTVLSAVLIGCLLGIGLLIYFIYLGAQAYKGNWVTIPFVTDFAKQQGWI